MGWSRRRAQTEHACMCAQLCSTLCDPMDCSPPGSSVHGILLAKILQWVAIFFPRRSSQPGDRIHVSCIAAAKSRQSCLTLCDPMDCSLPGSSVHGSFQARVLEWVASAFSVPALRSTLFSNTVLWLTMDRPCTPSINFFVCILFSVILL